MKGDSSFCLCSAALLSVLFIFVQVFAAVPAAAEDETQRIVEEIITLSDSAESVEIETSDLEQAQEQALAVLNSHDRVLEYEASVCAPDMRLICTPFLPKDMECGWRFLVLYQEAPSMYVVCYNLTKDEFRKIVENLYAVAIYHFEPEE